MSKLLRIFLASSSELVEDRKEFEIFIRRKNATISNSGFFIELIIWEDFIDHLSRTRLQDEYNNSIQSADIFVMLFFSRVGKYTREEFHEAYSSYANIGKPLIYTYFKSAPILTTDIKKDDINSLFDFQDLLKDLEHYFKTYKNTDQLLNHFSSQLEKIYKHDKQIDDKINDKIKIDYQSELSKALDFTDVATDVTEFDEMYVKEFRRQMREDLSERISSTLSQTEFINEAGLLKDNRLTHAGVLLFGKVSSAKIPSAITQCVVYFGNNKTANRDSTTYEGPVSLQIERSYNFLISRMEKYEFSNRLEDKLKVEYKYPLKCLRELIANAHVHRNYSDFQRCIHVRMYNSHIEISSPGSWIGNSDVEFSDKPITSFESQSIKRNHRLAKVISWIKQVELEGSGIPKSILDCEESGSPIPLVTFKDNFIKITVFPRKDWSNIVANANSIEEKLWSNCSRLHTLESYRTYLAECPKGSYRKKAEEHIDSLTKVKNKEIQLLIEDIKNNESNYTAFKIRKLINVGDLTEEDLIDSGVITRRALSYYLNPPDFSRGQVGWSDLVPKIGNFTDIYFLGQPSSGKTCILAGMLYHADKRALIDLDTDNMIGTRYAHDLIRTIEIGYAPPSTTSDGINYINANILTEEIRKYKNYPFNFMEMSGEIFVNMYNSSLNYSGVSEEENDHLNNENRKIICFTVDYKATIDDSFNASASQSHMCETVLKLLEKHGTLDKTDGVFIVVTKVDLITSTSKIEEVIENFINKYYLSLWRLINGLSNQYGFNVRIVPFSLGIFMLQRTFKYNFEFSKALLENIIESAKSIDEFKNKNKVLSKFFNLLKIKK